MITALIRLTRPYYSLPLSAGLIVITSYLVNGNLYAIGADLFIAFLSLYLVLSAGYILNDVCDIAVDKINCPDKILPAQKMSKSNALISVVLMFTAGLILSALCGWKFFAVMTLITISLIIYDLYSKKIWLFKNVLVAILATSLYPLAFTLADPVITPRVKVLFIHPIWFFLTTLGYEMLKDIQDTKGDSIVTKPRIAAYRAKPSFLYLARLLIVFASMLTILPWLFGYCKTIYLITSLSAIALAAAACTQKHDNAIKFIYAEVVIITLGSLADLMVYGP